MSETDAKQWLHDAAKTASDNDFAAHMDLISRRVALHGVPGFEVIGYDDWAAQCQQEFGKRLINSVSYDGFILVADTGSQVMFKTFETVEAADGKVNAQGIEVLLEQEADGKWRLVQERVLPAEESAHYGLGAVNQ